MDSVLDFYSCFHLCCITETSYTQKREINCLKVVRRCELLISSSSTIFIYRVVAHVSCLVVES